MHSLFHFTFILFFFVIWHQVFEERVLDLTHRMLRGEHKKSINRKKIWVRWSRNPLVFVISTSWKICDMCQAFKVFDNRKNRNGSLNCNFENYSTISHFLLIRNLCWSLKKSWNFHCLNRYYKCHIFYCQILWLLYLSCWKERRCCWWWWWKFM